MLEAVPKGWSVWPRAASMSSRSINTCRGSTDWKRSNGSWRYRSPRRAFSSPPRRIPRSQSRRSRPVQPTIWSRTCKATSFPCFRSPSTARCGRRARTKARRDAEAEVHPARDRFAALAAEREVLLREVNHRVGNSLQIIASLLHLQASSTDQEDVKAALTNAMGRVAAVAQVHRRLYTSQDLKSVLLNQYLEALLEDLRRSAEGNRMSRLTLTAESIEIDPDRAVAIGIIVNELVMNAVKYAYPDGAGPIHVELRPQDEELLLSITDDGVGLNVKVDPRSTGMGQRIVTAMATKLDACVERDPTHTGTRIMLRFPRATPPAVKPANAAAGCTICL